MTWSLMVDFHGFHKYEKQDQKTVSTHDTKPAHILQNENVKKKSSKILLLWILKLISEVM